MVHARAFIQGATNKNSTIVLSMNMEFAAYLSAYLEGMKASTQHKTVRRAFAIVGKKLVAEGKKNLQERQTTHNKSVGHVPLIRTFQSKVVAGKKTRTADMKVYAGFDKHGHHSIWADRGYARRESGGYGWHHSSKARLFEDKQGYGHRVKGNYFWTDVRMSSSRIGAPLIIKGIEQALGEGNLMKNLRFDGREYTREQLHVVKELL